MKTIMEGGHFAEKGYYYKLYFNHPIVKCYKTVNMQNREHIVRKFEATSGFLLTRNPSYVNIRVTFLGFGLGLEIQSREN